MPVQPVAGHSGVAYDILIMATLDRPAANLKRLRDAGVPDHKVLMLQPASPPVATR